MKKYKYKINHNDESTSLYNKYNNGSVLHYEKSLDSKSRLVRPERLNDIKECIRILRTLFPGSKIELCYSDDDVVANSSALISVCTRDFSLCGETESDLFKKVLYTTKDVWRVKSANDGKLNILFKIKDLFYIEGGEYEEEHSL